MSYDWGQVAHVAPRPGPTASDEVDMARAGSRGAR
jgi:hypothetical protein